MRTLVIGAGALGGYYGGCLVRAGHDVTFMVRPRRAEQLARTGLAIISPGGDFTVPAKAILATDIPGPFDLVLVGTKAYSLDQAMEEFAAAVGPNSMILPILNGLRHLDRLTARFGAERVLGGLANVSAGLDADGRVVHFMPNNVIAFGELAGGASTRASAVETMFKSAGVDARASDNIMHDMWEKFVQLSMVAGSTCLMRASIGTILAAQGGKETLFRLFDECCAIASASGFAPRPAFIEFDKALMSNESSPLKASMLRDIERGSVTEGEHILGDMTERARSFGIETPILNLARTHVAAYEIART
jgi:2-dehydropantoate 2-reductase